MDCRFKTGKNIFRYRVADIVIDEDQTLVATNNMADYFYTLSGPVNLGEMSEDAAVRLLKEKTGAAYRVERLLRVVETFFDYEFNGTKYDFQEVTFYYLLKPLKDVEMNLVNKIGGGRTETLHWMPLSDLKVKDVRPKVGKETMIELPDNVETIINYESSEDFN